MKKQSILGVCRVILKVLSRKGAEFSISGLAEQVGTGRKTVYKAVDFLLEVGLVRERKGEVRYKAERLFRLR